MDVYLLLVLALLDGAPWTNTGDERGPANVHYVSALANEEVAYCPYVKTCVHNYDTRLVDEYDSCCRPCNSDEGMECCSDIMPCKQPPTNANNKELVCIPTTVKRGLPEPGMLAIATCKKGAGDDERTKCLQVYDIYRTDVHDIVPVNDFRNYNTYRNIYCALCNGVNRGDVQFWSAYLQCDTNNPDILLATEIQKLVDGKHQCDIHFSPPSPVPPLQQCSHVIRHCNETGNWQKHDPTHEENCFNATNVSNNSFVVFKDMVFINEICSDCNPTPGLKTKLTHDFSSPALSMLISFNERKGLDSSPSAQCMSGTVFHEPKGECIAARCSMLRQLEGNTCVRTFSRVDNFVYVNDVRLKPDVKLTVETAYDLVGLMGTRLNKFLRSVFGNIVNIIFEVILISDLKYKSYQSPSKIRAASLLWYEVHLKLLNLEEQDPEQKLEQFLYMASTIGLNVTSPKHEIHFEVLLFDGRDSLMNVVDDSVMQCSFLFIDFEPCTDGPLYTYSFKGHYLDNVTAIRYIGRDKSLNAATSLLRPDRNILEMRECPFVEISVKQFAWEETDHNIEIRNGTFSLNFSDFLYGENETTVWICLSTLYKLEQVRNGHMNRLVNYFDVYMYLLLFVIPYAQFI